MTDNTHRSSHNHPQSKYKESYDNALYIAQTNFLTILHAQFHQQFLLLCTKKSISIYNTDLLSKQYQIRTHTHCACFIPFTSIIVYVQSNDEQRNVLVFWDYKRNIVNAKVTFHFDIQSVKASRRCIIMASLQHLYILHFPTLEPIYEGHAGNGFKVIYDISREGLTLAHHTHIKGQVMIRNFTNIQTNKLLTDIRSRSRTQSIGNVLRESSFSRNSRLAEEKQDQIKVQIKLQAHNQHIMIVRLSPNGYRTVTSSSKGTVIRMFSSLNGDRLSEFRMGYDLSPTVDIQFIYEGTQIVCLNDSNQINLFHARMSELQLLSQSSRKGSEIYEQQNPKSYFSFLGFINENFNHQHPFSYYKLDTKGIQIKQQKQKMQSQYALKKQKQKINSITQIKQVHESQIQPQNDKIEHFKTTYNPPQQIQPNAPQIKETSHYGQIKVVQVQESQQHLYLPIKGRLGSVEKKHSLSGNSKFERLKSKGNNNRQSSIKSASKLAKKPSEVVKFGEKEILMHFRGIINFGDITNIKILQSKYFFQLKYDPFNGGQMIEKTSINILKHPLFGDL